MPVFNWLLIDSGMAVGDNKLLPACKREREKEREAVHKLGLSVLF